MSYLQFGGFFLWYLILEVFLFMLIYTFVIG